MFDLKLTVPTFPTGIAETVVGIPRLFVTPVSSYALNLILGCDVLPARLIPETVVGVTFQTAIDL